MLRKRYSYTSGIFWQLQQKNKQIHHILIFLEVHIFPDVAI